jgi:hypothetical protein
LTIRVPTTRTAATAHALATPAAGRSTSGRPISGTWQADTEVVGTGTLLEMLQRTIEKEVTGMWQSGRWALKGSRLTR